MDQTADAFEASGSQGRAGLRHSVLGPLVGSVRGPLVLAGVTSVLGGLVGAVLVALINTALGAPPAALARLGLMFAGASAAMLVLRWVSKLTFMQLSQLTLAELRWRLAIHWAHAPYPEFERTGRERLLAVLVDDVQVVSRFFVELPRLVLQGAVIAGCFAYLAWLSPAVALFSLALVLLGSGLRVLAAARAVQHALGARAEEERLFGHFSALFAGAKELALHRQRREAFVSGVIAGSARSARDRGAASDRWQVGAIQSGVALSYGVLSVAAFVLGAALRLPPEVRTGSVLVLLYMMLPVHALLGALPEITRTRLALARIAAVGIAREPGAPDRALGAGVPLDDFQSLELRGVVHRRRLEHDEEPFVVGPIDLTLRRGEILFLVGGNGSGKSTLAKLIVGLYEPEAGEIFVNGARVAASDRESYRQGFSAVFADFHVFERLLGCGPDDVAARAKHWLDRLGLAHKVEVRGDALSTTQLSSGQRKRLALLVAALEERPICCFDEWAADQDPEYKRIFYTELLPALAAQGRTLIVITHDDQYFHVATRCVALEAGRLASLEPARGREERPGPAPAGDAARGAVGPSAPGAGAGASWS